MIELPARLPFGAAELVLNVAGPRESRCPGIYARAFGFLARLYRGFDVTNRPKVAERPRVANPQPVAGARVALALAGAPSRH